jgi:hypothetical protein
MSSQNALDYFLAVNSAIQLLPELFVAEGWSANVEDDNVSVASLKSEDPDERRTL